MQKHKHEYASPRSQPIVLGIEKNNLAEALDKNFKMELWIGSKTLKRVLIQTMRTQAVE